MLEVGGFRLNFALKLSRYLQSLTNTYPVVEEKKMTGHFYINRESWMDKGKIWPVMPVDQPLLRPLYCDEVSENQVTFVTECICGFHYKRKKR